jgi:hypothetical protein
MILNSASIIANGDFKLAWKVLTCENPPVKRKTKY